MEWLKLNADFINDPKMRRYFTKSERADWVSLLCLASKSKERGVILIPDDEIAYALDLTDDEWQDLCEKLTERRMIHRREDSAVVLTNFSKHQYDKPSDRPEATAERKRAQRSREKEEQGGMSRDVTRRHATDKIRVEEIRLEAAAATREEPEPEPIPIAAAAGGLGDAAAAQIPQGEEYKLSDSDYLSWATTKFPRLRYPEMWHTADEKRRQATKNPDRYVRTFLVDAIAKLPATPSGNSPPLTPNAAAAPSRPTRTSEEIARMIAANDAYYADLKAKGQLA